MSNEYFDSLKHGIKIGVLKHYNQGGLHAMVSITPLHNHIELTEYDAIVMYLGWNSDMSVGFLTIMKLMQTLEKLGYDCKNINMVEHRHEFTGNITYHLHIDVQKHSNQDVLNEYKLQQTTQEVEELKNLLRQCQFNSTKMLKEKDNEIEKLNIENDMLVSEVDDEIKELRTENNNLLIELTELRQRLEDMFKEPKNNIPQVATFIDIVEDTQIVSQDPFELQKIGTTVSEYKQQKHTLSPVAKAALKREALFKSTAYGKRIYKVIQSK
jgi:predicted nuclease with TOPRIM domain